ncbi:MAG: hypothetical protein KF837_19780 [Labilithrix sp.]|nr:hypothetical protein [Labilithrix sp.]
MKPRLVFLATSLVLAAAAGCYTGSAVDTNSPYPHVAVESTEPETEDSDDEEEPSKLAEGKGLPCDVALLIKTACGSCHGATPKNGAENTIATWEDLTAESAFDPSKTVAEVALARMKSEVSPMPPSGNLGKDEIDILEEWIDGGMKKGTCAPPKAPKSDAGSGEARDAGRDAAPAPRPSVCTSGVTADPDRYGGAMRPGNACISCHASQSGPTFVAAGTVYPTLVEPNDCNGTNGTNGTKVLIIDANGVMRVLPVNSAGNFWLRPPPVADAQAPASAEIAKPYKAVVVRGNQIREMKGTQSETDCNTCHTERGRNGAPGRIMAP